MMLEEIQKKEKQLDLNIERYDGKETSREKPLKVYIVDDDKQFQGLSSQWRKLTDIADVPVYLTFEWLSSWWKHFGKHPKRELFILVVYHESEIAGIVPFFKGISAVGSVTIQQRLNLMGSGVSKNERFGFIDDYGYSDFLDVIVHPDYEKEVAEEIVGVLSANPMKADLINFQHVSDESFVVTEILPLLADKELDYHLEKTDECPFIPLPDSLETYKKELGPSSRRRRFRKNLNPVGNKYAIEQAKTWEMVDKGLDNLYELHQERWNSLGYPGLFFDKRYFNFVKEMCQKAIENDWLWFQIGKDQTGTCAIRLALHYKARFYDWVTGFDMSSPVSDYSPGLGLLALMIKDAIENDANRIELLRGDERYKFDFTDHARNNWRLSIQYYSEKSFTQSVLNSWLQKTAKIYTQLDLERTLLKVHYQQEGALKMFYSYSSFRFQRVLEKLRSTTIYKKIKKLKK